MCFSLTAERPQTSLGSQAAAGGEMQTVWKGERAHKHEQLHTRDVTVHTDCPFVSAELSAEVLPQQRNHRNQLFMVQTGRKYLVIHK